MPWRDEFCRAYALVSGEAATVDGPLVGVWWRLNFSGCGGPFVSRADVERITAWLKGRLEVDAD